MFCKQTFALFRYFGPLARLLAADGLVEDLDDVGAFWVLVSGCAGDGDVDVVVRHVRVDRYESVVDVADEVSVAVDRCNRGERPVRDFVANYMMPSREFTHAGSPA